MVSRSGTEVVCSQVMSIKSITRLAAPRHERRRAQGLTEYLLILALIALVSIATVSAYGTTIHKLFGGSTEKVAQLKLALKD